MTRRRWKLLAWVGAFLGAIGLWWATPPNAALKRAATWQRLTEPGKLSAAHRHLEQDCAACHAAVRGVEPARCILCHANNESVLQRQPTAFHASIASCKECHPEHRGFGRRPTEMDHRALVRIGLRQLASGAADSENQALRSQLLYRIEQGAAPHKRISAEEALLDCSTCHANDDQHFGLFGTDCAQCHATDRWVIPEYRHPSPRSTDCAQCHQAPPSHYMMHFKMISQRVAGQHQARVDQCYLCHQTTSWNDIKRAGWYKHH
ncbi:MAG: cytochrome c3 family protein [Planctomycetes bacterium]|nr:cytochrome c3 family protein [Planctomycetota bacterium]